MHDLRRGRDVAMNCSQSKGMNAIAADNIDRAALT